MYSIHWVPTILTHYFFLLLMYVKTFIHCTCTFIYVYYTFTHMHTNIHTDSHKNSHTRDYIYYFIYIYMYNEPLYPGPNYLFFSLSVIALHVNSETNIICLY